jgi:CheY-like chemotaxis protein
VRDITARKETEDRLAAAQVAAEAAAAAKSEFLATMSHELRTPLTSIIGFAGLLQARGKLGETEARFVRRINDASRMLLTVVNDILEFSKLEAGRTELESRVFDLRELVDDTAALVLGAASDKGLALRSAIDPLAPSAPARRPRPAAAGSAQLAQQRSEVHRGRLRGLEGVGGAGFGRPRSAHLLDHRHRAGHPGGPDGPPVQRFSQADGSMSRRYGGTGLGLAICRGLVELMHGQIGVDSSEGRGSRFWFTVALPLAPALASAPALTEPDPDRCPAGRVLVADDSEASRELIRLMVTALGHDVDLVEDGAAAVEAVRCGPAYDLVLMDVHMPVLDGLLATRRIRALGAERGALPVIALTADVLPDQIARCREAGMDDHVAKPILPAALAKALTRWLDPSSLHSTGVAREALAS